MRSMLVALFVATLINSTYVLAQSDRQEKLQPITVILDWLINPNHAPLFVAQQQGFFQQRGLDVKIIAPTDPTDPPKLVAMGNADIAIDYQPHLLLEMAQGLPLIQIGSLVDRPLSSLVVLADSPTKSIAALKGKRIGYSTGGIDNVIIKTMLEHNGLSIKDVELINVHYDLTKALLTKKIDAAQGLMRNIELITMGQLHQPGHAFYPEDNGVPIYEELVLIAKSGNQHAVKIQRFMEALQMGVDYLLKNPETSWQQFAKEHPELNNDLNHRAWYASLQYFSRHPEKIHSVRCQKLAVYLAQAMQLKMPPNTCTPTLTTHIK